MDGRLSARLMALPAYMASVETYRHTAQVVEIVWWESVAWHYRFVLAYFVASS